MAVDAHRLNMLAAIFFPVATLSAVYHAIFGMFHAHGPEWSSSALFWTIMAVGLVCGFVLAKAIARKPEPITRPVLKVKPKRR